MIRSILVFGLSPAVPLVATYRSPFIAAYRSPFSRSVCSLSYFMRWMSCCVFFQMLRLLFEIVFSGSY